MAIDKQMEPFFPGETTSAELEIEIGLPAVAGDGAGEPVITEMEDGSIEIIFDGATQLDEVMSAPHDANLVDFLDETVINTLTTDLIGLVDADEQSRKDWEETLIKGLETLGMKYEERTEPWTGACGVHSTVLTEAAIRFQAESMSETFPAQGPVRTKIVGVETPDKTKAAARVQADMNLQLTEVMVEYRPEHERLLYSLGLMGSAFKKVYQDPTLNRPTAVYISAEDMIVPYGASNIYTAERVTHRMRKTVHEMDMLIDSGFYADADLGEPVAYHTELEEKKADEAGFTLTDDNRYCLLEIHTEIRIPELDPVNEPARPYVVTVEKGSGKCVAIRRNWDENDPLKQRLTHFTHYTYIPGFGFYGLGLIHIIGGYAHAGTSLIRQLVDAGTLSNLPAGFKTKGMRVKGDDESHQPGEFKDVDVPSGTLKENIMTLPYKEPSQVLFMLLERITDEGRRLGAISDMKISDMSANAPVGTTLALLERTLKPMAAVQSRVHFAMKQEFKLLKALIADNTEENYAYDPGDGYERARKSDYAIVEVIPVSDPNSSTMAQRVVQYQTVIQMSQMAPQIYNLPQLHRQMLEVIGIKNAEKLVPLADDATPVDPVSENMNVLVGKPLQAFMYQDHDAHIATHMAFMQDPMIMGSIGQNPMAQQIMGALQAHLAEHIGFAYRRQMEERLGVTLPMPNETLPPEIEVQLSRAVADGAKQLTQMHQQEAAQKQAQEQAADPAFQLEQQKVANQKQEIDRKTAKDRADIALRSEELELKDKEITTDAQLEAARLGVDVDTTDKKLKVDVLKSAIGSAGQTTRRE